MSLLAAIAAFKVGAAKLYDSITKSTTTNEFKIPPCTSTVNTDAHGNESAPYLGIGVSTNPASHFAVRLAYEAIYSDCGDPTTMLSIGFAWER